MKHLAMCFLILVGILGGVVPIANAKTQNYGYISGSNIFGRKGFFYTDTAEVPKLGVRSGTGHFLYSTDSNFSRIQIPVGVGYGISQDFEASANLSYISTKLDTPAPITLDKTQSGLGSLTVGGKYRIPGNRKDRPDFGLGVDIGYGPLSEDLGGRGVDVTFKGMVTHVAESGLLLNGGLGLLRIGSRDRTVTVGGTTVNIKSDSSTEVQANGGLGWPLTPTTTGIVELAINQFGEDDGVFAVGLRHKKDERLQLQLFLGMGVGDVAPDLTISGGVVYGFGR